MNEDVRTRTYEELLMNRITRCFEAMDIENERLFDELLEEIEMLFKLVPQLYNDLQRAKQIYQSATDQAYQLSAQKIAMLTDDYNKEIRRTRDTTVIEWSFRKDMLEAVMNILNQNQMIPFTNPIYAEIETQPIEPAEPEKEVVPPSQPSQLPAPTQPPAPVPVPEPAPAPIQNPTPVKANPITPPVQQRQNIKPSNPPPTLDDVEAEVTRRVAEARRMEAEAEDLAQNPVPPLKK